MQNKKRHKITIKMLAEHLGISVSTVYKWNDDKKRLMIEGMKADIEKGVIADPRK